MDVALFSSRGSETLESDSVLPDLHNISEEEHIAPEIKVPEKLIGVQKLEGTPFFGILV